MVISKVVSTVKGIATGKTAFILGLGLVMGAYLSTFFNISMEIDSSISRTMDPGYPYIQAVGAHYVNGRPFIEYLSLAVMDNSTVVDGLNVSEELEVFGEHFILRNKAGETILEVGEGEGKDVILAVPPQGSLVLRYAWN